MSLVSPLWLWALAGLALPLAIHLLSRGRRQRVAMGSIRHLTGSDSQALRRVRLSGWPQLLTRMLLLAVLSVALAGPRWLMTGDESGSGGWVLIDPDLLAMTGDSKVAGGELGRHLAAARKNASSVRLLTSGLPELTKGEVLERLDDAWSLLREADELAPVGVPLTVFTIDRVAWLRGRRPALTRPVEWWVQTDSGSNHWIQRAVSTVAGEQTVTIGESQAGGTRFATYTWSATDPPPRETGLEVDSDAGTLELIPADSHPEDDGAPLPAAPRPLGVAMSVGSGHEMDAGHLRRGLRVVGKYLGRDLVWVADSEARVDLEIRLGSEPTADSQHALVLTDSDAAYESCKGLAFSASTSEGLPLLLRRCSTSWQLFEGVAWWVDGWGRPFIARRSGAVSAVYELQGRFDARWSSLVTSPALPRLLLDLVEPDDRSTGGSGGARSDRRATTGRQRMPRIADAWMTAPARQSATPESLAWIVLALLLVLERWMSRRTT